MIRIFIPSIILGMFLYQTFDIDDYQDRLANLSLSLLTYIAIMEHMRCELPDISALTHADKILIIYIILSLFPIFDRLIGCKDKDNTNSAEEHEKTETRYIVRWCLLVVQLLCFLWIIYMYSLSWFQLN